MTDEAPAQAGNPSGVEEVDHDASVERPAFQVVVAAVVGALLTEVALCELARHASGLADVPFTRLAGAASFGLGLGLAFALTELVLRGRRVIALLVGPPSSLLAFLGGAYPLPRAKPRGRESERRSSSAKEEKTPSLPSPAQSRGGGNPEQRPSFAKEEKSRPRSGAASHALRTRRRAASRASPASA